MVRVEGGREVTVRAANLCRFMTVCNSASDDHIPASGRRNHDYPTELAEVLAAPVVLLEGYTTDHGLYRGVKVNALPLGHYLILCTRDSAAYLDLSAFESAVLELSSASASA